MDGLRVLIIVGVPGIRRTLVDIVGTDPLLSVSGAVADPLMAAKRIAKEIPDVVILDLATPHMDAVAFLQKLMEQCPLPVVVLATRDKKGSAALTAALDTGALDAIVLPETEAREYLLASTRTILDKIKSVVSRHRGGKRSVPALTIQPKLTADELLPPAPHWAHVKQTERVICMGASTGGTDSLLVVLEKMSPRCPGILIVQHMPEGFTTTFARRLNDSCSISVKEAENGDAVLPGRALLAPGNQHMLLARRGDRYFVEVKNGPLVSRHRPSVDVLFRSAARSAGSNAIGVIMTGMGDDGAQGLLEMRQAGAVTLAEHESSCVVYGMPKVAIERGGAEFIVPLSKMADKITQVANKRK
ncbi:MAG: chemotaxis-specific protein-glutamate methyltransferase CheB [Magnetococcus sp. DMHC-1]